MALADIGNFLSGIANSSLGRGALALGTGGLSEAMRYLQDKESSLQQLNKLISASNAPAFLRNEPGVTPQQLQQAEQQGLMNKAGALAALPLELAQKQGISMFDSTIDTPERQLARQQEQRLMRGQQADERYQQGTLAQQAQNLALQRQQEQRLLQQSMMGEIPKGYQLRGGRLEQIPGFDPSTVINPQEQFKVTNDVFKAYRGDIEPVNTFITTINTAKELAKQDSGAADFQLAKMAIQAYDRRASAVTDNEMTGIMNTGGMQGRFGNAFEGYVMGTKFTPTQRKSIVKTLDPMEKQLLKQRETIDKGYTKLTRPYGIDFNTIKDTLRTDIIKDIPTGAAIDDISKLSDEQLLKMMEVR